MADISKKNRGNIPKSFALQLREDILSRGKKLFVLIIVFLLAGFIFVAIQVVLHMIRTDPTKARLVKGKMPVSVNPVEIKTIDYVIGASGQTQEFGKAALTARIEQPVISVKVNIGERVQKGQVLLEFDQKLMKAIVDQAKDSFNRTKTGLDYSKLNYQRLLNLYNQNLIAKVDLEKADEKVKDAEYEYSTAVRQLGKATQDMDFTTVRSPITGIVLEKTVNTGETPKLNEQMFLLGVIDNIFTVAKVPEEKISYIHLKQEGEVHFDSFPNDVFKGEIVKIDPQTDPKTRTFNAFMKILNKNLKLTPGLTGFARIIYHKKALVAPSISIINPVGENATVFIVDSNSIAHIKQAQIGISAGGLTEILGGLKEGDNVVFAGIQFLKDGDRVNVMEGKP